MYQVFGPLQSERSVLQALLSELDSLVHNLFSGNNIVDQAKLLSFVGLDLLAGEQELHAVLAVNVASEANDTAGRCDDAQTNLGATELSALRSNNHVAGKSDFHAATSCGAVASCNNGLGAGASSKTAKAMLGYSLAFAAFGELGEILASTEYLASAGNDDCTNSRIGFGVVHDVFHGLGSRSVKRICHIGAIDAND